MCGPTVGFDVQLANWLWDGETATQIDFTSPFTLTPNGKDMTYDAHAFLQEYPLVVRPYPKHELTKIIQRYTTAEGALADMVSNMLKEGGLDGWVDPAIATINRRPGNQFATRDRPADARRGPQVHADGVEAEEITALVVAAHRPQL